MAVVAYRLLIGAVILIAYVKLKGETFPKLTDSRWLWYFGLGLTGMVIPFFLISTGQLKVDSGLSAIIVGAMPLITIVLAHFFTDERLTPIKTLGFFIGFLGIVVLFLPDNLSLDLVDENEIFCRRGNDVNERGNCWNDLGEPHRIA